MWLYVLLSFVAGGAAVIILELQGLEALLEPYRNFLDIFFGNG